MKRFHLLFVLLGLVTCLPFSLASAQDKSPIETKPTEKPVTKTVTKTKLPKESKSPTPQSSKHGLEVRLLSLLSPGLSVDYERWISGRFSVQGGAGLRNAVTGDYSGLAMTLSLGTRFWLHTWGPSWMRAPNSGFFLEVMTDLQRMAITDEISGQDLPSTYTPALTLGGGFRLAVIRRLTFTLTSGLSSRVDIPIGAARAQVRFLTLRYGLRAGFLF